MNSQTNSMMKNWTVPATATRIGLTDGRLIVRLANLLRVHTRRLSVKFTIQVLIESPDALPLSFGAVADLLHDVLPIDARLNDETIRMQVLKTAERLEAELGPEQFA